MPGNSVHLHSRISDVRVRARILFFSFAFVRNPWAKMVSHYFWDGPGSPKEPPAVETMYHPYAGNGGHFYQFPRGCPPEELSFERYIKDYLKERGALVDGEGLSWETVKMMPYLIVNGKIAVNFIGRLENAQADFDHVCDKIRIPRQTLPRLNTTKHRPYWEYYDDESREIVADVFSEEIETFGYEFGK